MKPLQAPLLLDENLPAKLAPLLRQRGMDVHTVHEFGLAGQDDAPLLAYAEKERFVLVTQDRDFGRLAFLHGLPYFGVIYLRPGTLDAMTILRNLLALRDWELDPPFLLVVRREADGSIRVRST